MALVLSYSRYSVVTQENAVDGFAGDSEPASKMQLGALTRVPRLQQRSFHRRRNPDVAHRQPSVQDSPHLFAAVASRLMWKIEWRSAGFFRAQSTTVR